ncbi:MAG TPA: NADPH-dependent F420 reductase [Actinomycetota bacterium]|nr:NADPH-dependent F420 reductase [Actinomycetota bacterium]
MKIGIVGSGHIGGNLARLFARAGHEVMMSSRHPERLADEAAEIGARTGSIADASAFGDVVVFSVPWSGIEEATSTMTGAAGKIVVDTTNPYGPNGPLDLGDDTSSEIVARLLPDVRIVKAFNTIHFADLASQGKDPRDGRRAIPIAGDDPGAKDTVSRLIDEIGFEPVDTGSLRVGGRKQEPGAPVYNSNMTADEVRNVL